MNLTKVGHTWFHHLCHVTGMQLTDHNFFSSSTVQFYDIINQLHFSWASPFKVENFDESRWLKKWKVMTFLGLVNCKWY